MPTRNSSLTPISRASALACSNHESDPDCRGFTLIELVVVMLLMAVLTAIAVPRFSTRAAFDDLGFRNELASAARYAQKRALATGCPVRLRVTPTGYSLVQPAAAAGCGASTFSSTIPVPHPASGDPFAGIVPEGVTFSGSPALAQDVVFDARGGTGLASNLTLQVGTLSLVIHRDSGYVEVP